MAAGLASLLFRPPTYELQPLRDYMAFTREVLLTVKVYREGIEHILEKASMTRREDDEALARSGAQASEQREKGYPLMHNLAIVALWSGLETAIKDFVARTLQQTPSLLKVDSLLKKESKIQVRLLDYLSMSESERYESLVNQAYDALASQADARFDGMLELVQVKVDVTAADRQALNKLWQDRNLIAHRRGIVDKAYLKGPPKSLKVGEQLVITLDEFIQLEGAAERYISSASDFAEGKNSQSRQALQDAVYTYTGGKEATLEELFAGDFVFGDPSEEKQDGAYNAELKEKDPHGGAGGA